MICNIKFEQRKHLYSSPGFPWSYIGPLFANHSWPYSTQLVFYIMALTAVEWIIHIVGTARSK